MAREIKFRAKFCKPLRCAVLIPPHRKEGEWVIGDLHLFTRIPHIHEITFEKYPIDITTIGQFTGLYDKNGNEIYEGDIVHLDTWSPYAMQIVFLEGAFCLADKDGHYLGDIHYIHHAEVEQCTVIGNIYDNKELLK